MTSSQLQFEIDHEQKLVELFESLRDRTYRPGPCIRFVEKSSVYREVFASGFRDRVVHHLYYNAVAPVFDRLFIYDTSSCRKGKGTLFGVQRMEHHIRAASNNYTQDCWGLKVDIEGYFMSIDRRRLNGIVRRQLLCHYKETAHNLSLEFILWLTDIITLKDPLIGCIRVGPVENWQLVPRSKQLEYSPPGVGLIIGDLTSQLYSNVYQSSHDHYIKRRLKVRHFHHYVDDGVFLAKTRERLERIEAEVNGNLRRMCGLQYHPRKIHYYHIWDAEKRMGDALPFLGGRIHAFYTHLSKRTTRNYLHFCSHMPEDCLRRWQAANSYVGQMRHFKAARLSRMVNI